MKQKLAIVTTHPIQYNAPWFRLLAQRGCVDIKVFYTWSQAQESVKDKNFGRTIKWDVPLLDGYDYEFVENISENPGTHHFKGIVCPSLIDKIEEYNPSYILVFGWNFVSHLKVLRRFKGEKTIWFRGDSTLLNESRNLKTVLRRVWLKWVYSHIDAALYVGIENKKYFLKHGLKERQLIFTPHAVDNKRFMSIENPEIELEVENWRSNLGYKNNDIVILYAGKFEPNKQVKLLIDAFLEVVKNPINKRLKLLLVGNGPLEEELKAVAVDSNFVQFLPFQNQSKMPMLYRLGDVFVLPSKSETWGLAINEAMASERPVIVSSQVGCAKNIVKSKDNGWVFNNKQELVRVLNDLQGSNLKRMGEHSLKIIKEYSLENIVASIEHHIK